jgi:hypothetical protein
MFLFRLKARRQIGLLLRNGPSVVKFQALFGVDSFPHGDTLDETFSNLEIDQIQRVVTGMTETLIRKKVLYRYRLLGIYFIVAIDGTGTISFNLLLPPCPGSEAAHLKRLRLLSDDRVYRKPRR